MTVGSDRNFDDLAERFSARVYGKLKGEIRHAVLWRDLLQSIPYLLDNTHPDFKKLSIIDIGAGLGQFAIRLAAQGHQVTYNDLSSKMTLLAKEKAQSLGLMESIQWNNQAYQDIESAHFQEFDLVLCHAVIEWLGKPQELIPHLKKILKSGGQLSLCFYNPVGRDYRNLICGNFKMLNQPVGYQSDYGSLTPNNPSSLEAVQNWLAESHFTINKASGIRVFTDYVLSQRGGNLNSEDVIKMELAYSDQHPFKWMGRYLHILSRL